MAIGWVDAAMLGVLLLSVLVGLWRGLVFELLSLAGWIAAWIAAQWFAPEASAWVPIGTPGSALNLGATFALVFIAALIVWSIAARLVRMLLRATPLSGIDRLLGAVFGLARGVVLLLVVAMVVSLTPFGRSPQWRASVGALWLHDAVRAVTPMLPPPWSRHLPA
jgi:membrane protein required for colicin V production